MREDEFQSMKVSMQNGAHASPPMRTGGEVIKGPEEGSNPHMVQKAPKGWIPECFLLPFPFYSRSGPILLAFYRRGPTRLLAWESAEKRGKMAGKQHNREWTCRTSHVFIT